MKEVKQAKPEDVLNGDRELFYDFRTNPTGEVIIKLRDLSQKPEFKDKFKDLD